MGRRIIIDELEFDVPYGKLAAKTWHEETDECKRVLAIHGWQDNSGSFDRLVPHLNHEDGLYIVGLDLPGHGKSSPFPAGSSYSDLSLIMEMRRCLIELDWAHPVSVKGTNDDKQVSKEEKPKRKYTILSHSLGAYLSIFYASLFPDEVSEIILLDYIKTRSFTPAQLLANTAESIDEFIETVPTISKLSSSNKKANKNQVVISQEACIVATIESRRIIGELSRDEAACLLKRSTVAISTPPNSVIFTRDLRLQSMLNLRDTFELSKLLCATVKCHVISILGIRSIYRRDPLFVDNLETMKEYMKSRAASHHVQWIDADHYFHLNRAEQAATFINRMDKLYSKSQVTFGFNTHKLKAITRPVHHQRTHES